MLWGIALILIILWLLGLVTGFPSRRTTKRVAHAALPVAGSNHSSDLVYFKFAGVFIVLLLWFWLLNKIGAP